MDVAVLVVDGAFDSGLAAVLDVLDTANALRSQVKGPPQPWDVTKVGLGTRARTGAGFEVTTTPYRELFRAPDLLVVPAVGLRAPAAVIDAVRAPAHAEALDFARTIR